MKILTVGQKVNFKAELTVLKALAHQGGIYYIVLFTKKGTPLKHIENVLWGVLNVDGSCEAIPLDVMKRATKIVSNLKNLE